MGCCCMWDYAWRYENILEEIYEEFGTYDPFEIARYLDIPIEYSPISQPLAKTTYLFNQPIITMSDELQDSNLKYFVCAHELGHIFKHTGIACAYDGNTHFRSGMERDANLFGFELCTLLYIEEYGEQPENVYQLSSAYGVPVDFYWSGTMH